MSDLSRGFEKEAQSRVDDHSACLEELSASIASGHGATRKTITLSSTIIRESIEQCKTGIRTFESSTAAAGLSTLEHVTSLLPAAVPTYSPTLETPMRAPYLVPESPLPTSRREKDLETDPVVLSKENLENYPVTPIATKSTKGMGMGMGMQTPVPMQTDDGFRIPRTPLHDMQ